jgi:bacterioferritin-associated ferredoxin
METTLPGIFGVGDCTGIEGAIVAQEEGRLAALRVCQQLGLITTAEASRRYSAIFKELRRLRKFEAALNQIFALRRGWLAGLADDVIICRCEEVTAGEIRKVIAEGFTNLSEIKTLTQAGMGPCQGRICEPIITEIISLEAKQLIAEVGFLSPRPPVKPVPFGATAVYDGS